MKPTPYPAYKPSGVEWLGDVPAHWEQLPGRACYFEKKSPNTGMQEATVLSLSYGQIVIKPIEQHHGLVPASFETYQVIEPGDIIIRPTDLQNDWTSLRFGLSRHHGAITSAYMCFQTRGIISREYGHLLLHTYDLKKIFYGLGSGLRQNLNWRDFQYLPCLVPPLPEQNAIVRYLNHATERIHSYISAKERLINLLEEQRQAVIHRAVTRGLDPNVRLKPSGVEWLGKVPTHWGVSRLKSYVRNVVDQTPPDNKHMLRLALEHVESWTGRYAGGGQDVHFDSQLKQFQADDVLFGKLRPYLAKVVRPVQAGICVGEFLVLRPHERRLSALYLEQLLRSKPVIDAINSSTFGAKMPRADWQFIGDMRQPVPPLIEQTSIVEYLEKATTDINAATSRSRREIELLEEYRTRLIADVVTGKLDVREATFKLPRVPDESRLPDRFDDASQIKTIDERTY